MSTRSYIVAVLTFLFLLGACSTQPPIMVDHASELTLDAIEQQVSIVTLDLDLATDPLAVDPAVVLDLVSGEVVDQLFSGLTDFATDSNKVIPELSTDWSISDDRLTWTFHMRDDVPWVRWDAESASVVQERDDAGNVRMVNAHDVVFGVKRTLDPATGSGFAFVLYTIKGAVPLNTAEEVTPELLNGLGIRALDDQTVEFTLENPASFFPNIVGLWGARPVPAWTIEENGDNWTEPGVMVSNGPYVLTTWVHDDTISLERNPYWPGWNELGSGNIDRIQYAIVAEESTAMALYETNELDTVDVPPQDYDRVQSDPIFRNEIRKAPQLVSYAVGFTMSKPPMDDSLVRKALSAAIDRQTIVDSLTNGVSIPANSIAPPGIFGSAAGNAEIGLWLIDHELGQEFAKQWMAEAGFPNGKGLTVRLTYMEFGDMARLAQAIQAMWAETFSEADFLVESLEVGGFLQSLDPNAPLQNAPMAWIGAWGTDYPDQNNWVHEVFHAKEGFNWPRAVPTEFESITKLAQGETDPAKREALYLAAERLLVEEEARIAPLYHSVAIQLDKPWLKRNVSPLGDRQLHTWAIDWKAKQAALSD